MESSKTDDSAILSFSQEATFLPLSVLFNSSEQDTRKGLYTHWGMFFAFFLRTGSKVYGPVHLHACGAEARRFRRRPTPETVLCIGHFALLPTVPLALQKP